MNICRTARVGVADGDRLVSPALRRKKTVLLVLDGFARLRYGRGSARISHTTDNSWISRPLNAQPSTVLTCRSPAARRPGPSRDA
ncbi:MAG TPA: hypothetical protein PLS03_00210 [Terrimicrobiaceae bacterium]|nr:hypothetical protein [Terrimicrobiaceae bacterium]